MTGRILITMDDLEAAVRSNAQLENAGFRTVIISSQDDSAKLLRSEEPDLVLLTGALQESPATTLLRLARDRSISTLGLVEPTAPDSAELARRIGLTAWLRKPADPAEVAATVSQLVERRRLQTHTGILGESPAIQEVLVKIEQMAPVSSTVLVEGESGTGKELVAHAIHELSPRRDHPFIAVNCSALPETLLESELFGHEKGSFTGAAERRLGRFELAHRGTLFLDEVGEMPLTTQVKLLRVLESRAFFRVGGSESIRTDVRVIAATNRSLKEQVSLGEFRDDLFYRLNVLYVYLPPLRERKGDIPILIRHFVTELSETHARPFPGISPGAMEILVNADWPGNVRQLRNLIDSMFVLAPDREVRGSDIPADIREGGTRLLPMRVPQQRREVQGKELEFIFRSLVELKLQVEDLRRRVEEAPARVGVIDVGRAQPAEYEEIHAVVPEPELESLQVKEEEVVYKAGMTMADVERAAIEAALRETEGNRRQAAERLGIGERTLYRKLKDYQMG
ncbi:MAG: sigma-54-dependent Fis family transcriptional regulator [Gemmatimonadota bacterium]|nr:MAG: sigma-54-dependent Fis family transcriptional regulator [Gemmatimonadota bacterium]